MEWTFISALGVAVPEAISCFVMVQFNNRTGGAFEQESLPSPRLGASTPTKPTLF